jgi:hypothetical protein
VHVKYAGKLKKPIARKRLGWLYDESHYLEDAQRIEDERLAKLPDLFAAHNVPLGDWQGLAMALAKAHVPGFKATRPPGRPNDWDAKETAEFKVDVDDIAERDGLSIVEAIKLVIRTTAWAEKTSSMTLPALEKRYYEGHDSKWIELVKKARSYEAIIGDE